MRVKKTFVILTAIAAVFMLVNTAAATNRVEVKVTSEPIQYQAICDKAGGFTLQFDSGSTLVHGDRITIDLPFQDNNNYVVLCRDIDLIISPVGTVEFLNNAPQDVDNGGSATWGWEGADADNNIVLESSGNSCPVIYTDDDPAAPSPDITTTNGGVYFHIYGRTGQSRITLDVIGENTGIADAAGTPDTIYSQLTVGSDSGDALILYFLDQQTNAGFDVDGIWTDEVVRDDTRNKFLTYDIAAIKGDNTLCIDLKSNTWQGATVNGNMDSQDDKFTFQPSNPQIAHVLSELDIVAFPCKDAKCGKIVLGTAPTQGASTCTPFDNEDGSGYCPNTHANNKIIIANNSGFFDETETYQINAEILVNGSKGDRGVYFTSGGIGVGTAQTLSTSNACSMTATTMLGATYKKWDGSVVTTPVAPNNNCNVISNERATVMLSNESQIFVTNNLSYLYIDLPMFKYDTSMVQEGYKVDVEITLLKAPCGELFSGTFCIGTFGCDAIATASTALLYPYFTEADADVDPFWDGFVITNISGGNGTATLTMYERDGDVATYSVSVPGNSMKVFLLSQVLDDFTLDTTSDGDGVLGNTRSYIVTCADFACDGFAMMGNTNDGTGMGYLPRRAADGGLPSSLCQ